MYKKEIIEIKYLKEFDVIIIAFILTAFILNYKYFDKVNIIATNILFLREDAIHIIISIFPFVLKVLSIALSMPKELIYGLENLNNKDKAPFS